jgi:hypothetical protein
VSRRPVQCCTLCPEIQKLAHRRLPLDTVLDFAGVDQPTLIGILLDHGHEATARQYGATARQIAAACPEPDQLTLNLGDTP